MPSASDRYDELDRQYAAILRADPTTTESRASTRLPEPSRSPCPGTSDGASAASHTPYAVGHPARGIPGRARA
jgi:hypothetical protein